MNQSAPIIWGYDIGDVIMESTNEFFRGDHLKTRINPGAFAFIRRNVERYGPQNNVIISKCGDTVAGKSLEILAYNRFYEETGFAPEGRIYFRPRIEQKAEVAQQEGVTHFVDNKIRVLKYMRGIVDNLYVFGPESLRAPTDMIPVMSFEDLSALT